MSTLRGICPSCKIEYFGWALMNPHNKRCHQCGNQLQIEMSRTPRGKIARPYVRIEKTMCEFGKIDILINNAGFIWEEPPEKVSLDTWNKTLAINATGTFLCSQEAGKRMIEQGYGKIINITSISGLGSVDPELSDTIPYSAAKGAIVVFTRDLARKWCKYNITVNAIAPGYFGTKMSKFLVEHRHQQLMNAIHMKRLGVKEEIQGVAVFMASSASNYITGHILVVDGGVVM